MNPTDLVASKDGSASLTKLAAASFHLLLFLTVSYLTWRKQAFDLDMWAYYGTFAVGHAILDKVGAQVKGFKDAQLVASNAPVSVTADGQTIVAK
jgi:hypothetical protein